MLTHNPVRRAVHSALLGSATKAVAVGSLLFAATAWGQSQSESTTSPRAADAERDVAEVVVVGSRIRRDTFNSPSPVQVVTREEVTSAGFASTTEALQSTAVTTGGAQINNMFSGFVTDGGPGANTISLRSLGPSRTLVLINGRRVAPAGTRGAVGSADLNVLPNAIIDRVEVLRDGASSIYGSDAIAGVVNVVTRSDVDGVNVELQHNQPLDDGGETTRASVVAGLTGDRWTFSGSIEYYNREKLAVGDRDWTKCNRDLFRDPETGESLDFIDPATGQPKCYPITTTGSNGVTINTIGTSMIEGVGAPGSVGTAFNRWRPNASITTGLVGFEGVGGGQNNLNVRDTFDPRMLDEDLISPAEIFTTFLQGTYSLESMGDAELYFEFLGTRRKSEQTLYRQLTLDYRAGSLALPASLRGIVALPDQGTSEGENVGIRAFIGFGGTGSDQTVDFIKPTLGLRGDLTFLPDWRYDINVSHSYSDAEYRQETFFTDKVTMASNVVAAPSGMDASLVRNGLTCAVNITNPGEACVPYPMLTADVIGGVLPGDFVDYILGTAVGNTEYKETVYSAAIDGPLFSLPAGEVQAVLGFEHRRAEIDDTPDINSINGNLYNLTSATPTRGKDNVTEVFTEVEIPLLAEMTAVNELTFNGSFRYTDYDSYGDDTTYKLGLMYSPVNWASLRVTKGTSYRAPALYEQFQGPTSGFLSQAGDPCNNYGVNPNAVRRANCASELPGNPTFNATSSIRVLSEGGAAAGLEAETSDNLTYGLILQPDFGTAGQLSIAVDYFDIEINNGVAQAGASNILQRCYDDPDFRAGGGFCRLVTRDPATNALTVSNAYTNIATQFSEGIDYTVRYEVDMGPGVFRVNAQATKYKSQALKLFVDDPLDEYNGTIEYPEWSANVDLTYTIGDWRFRYGVDWIDAMNSDKFLEIEPEDDIYDFHTGHYFEHYASVRWLTDEWEVTGGVRNIFDKEPPTISAGYYYRQGNAPLYSGYDYVGREVFLRIAKQF